MITKSCLSITSSYDKLWVALKLALTTLDEEEAPEEARYLLTRSKIGQSQQVSSVIMELITTIMVYKFEQLRVVQEINDPILWGGHPCPPWLIWTGWKPIPQTYKSNWIFFYVDNS
ncbi:MAG: Rpn family recombination-promoting nuclease/putative transposase [Scytonematopsis contorta HA4267-MV1]|nr:Rpn family recombination-promoting nuclease/putative transposase [Scytonematopsis contorta HA4267-MV1]